MAVEDTVEALLFDVFGTVVDWRGSIIADMTAFGARKGIAADWAAFTDDWRGLYQPSMEEVRSGRRAWTILDVLHRESLDRLLDKYRITGLSEAEKDHINRAWHRLKPWPDTVEGLKRLKSRYIIGTLSNGNVGLLTRMAKNAGLPWDVVLGAETARAYKPLPQAYLASAALLNLEPGKVMLVAAHNGDLAAAAKAGLRTAFVARPSEYGPHQDRDFKAEGNWDVVADSFTGVADAMGCSEEDLCMGQQAHPIAKLIVRQHHTAVSCADFQAVKSFFVDLIGFKVLSEIEDRKEPGLDVVTGLPGARCQWAMLELGGYHIELFRWMTPEGKPTAIRQCDHGFTHICFQVRDAEEVRRRMIAAGFEPLSEVLTVRGGRAKPFYCRGPEGLMVEFVEYPFGA